MPPLNELIPRFLDDQRELSSEELDALIVALRAQPARAVELREQLLVDDLVAQKLTLDRRNFLAQVEQRIADFHQAEDEIDQQVAELHSLATAPVTPAAQRAGAGWWWQGALALSLIAIVAGFFIAPQFLPPQPHVVAKVIEVGGPVATVRSQHKTSLTADESLFAGQRIESPAGGWLVLEYSDRTELRIGGDTLVTLDEQPGTGAKRVHLLRGELWADVTPQTGGPMQFLTPHAIATVLGTQLHLTATARDTLLAVEEGKVGLARLAGGEPINVAASESGLATSDSLALKPNWPASTDGAAFVFDPFSRSVPQTRDLATGNWLAAPLEPVGSAAVNEFNSLHELSGGHFLAPREGPDIVKLCRGSREFTLEIVIVSSPNQREPARIVCLESEDGPTCFALSQVDDELIFELRTDATPASAPLRTGLSLAAVEHKPTHLTLCYRDGEVTAYCDGQAIASRSDWHGSLATWQDGPLVIGADHDGNCRWHGTVESLAIYHRWLDSAEVARNVRNYRILSGRVP